MNRLRASVMLLWVLLSACTKPTPTPIIREIEVTRTPTATIEPTNTVEPTGTSVPAETATPKPTYTPRPTRTPRPTPTDTPEPEPIVYSGIGDDVIRIQKPADMQGRTDVGCFMHIEGNASARYFGVTSYDTNGEQLRNYVNTTNPYSGTRLLDIFDDEETAMLEVKAEGEWLIELQPTTPEYMFPRALIPSDHPNHGKLSVTSDQSGSGDEVLFIIGDAIAIRGTHKGSSNFIVMASGGESRRAVFNEIGDYDGKAVLPVGTLILEVLTEGEWTIAIE